MLRAKLNLNNKAVIFLFFSEPLAYLKKDEPNRNTNQVN